MSDPLKAPFPWFGGKSRVADLVWRRFGAVPNYVEPFFGSGAVLLGRGHFKGTETVNDKDAFLANFWRALQNDPDGVAHWADWPVSEADLLARHRWLDSQTEFVEAMKADPNHYDCKIAGWWVWGLCSWIGSGWCRQRGDGNQPEKIPHLGDAGMGINRKLPHLGDAGRGELIASYFQRLAERLRDVRVACGEWDRVLSPACTLHHGLSGVFLDPPYTEGDLQYSAGGAGGPLANAVKEWAVANGENPLLRIALCGYEGEHVMPENWQCVSWKARKGYQTTESGIADRARERIWFSPHCLNPQEELFK
jgi:DNA adenine methylase